MSSKLFVRRVEPAARVASRVFGSNPYPENNTGWGLKYLSNISYFRSVVNIPLPSPRSMKIPMYKEEGDFVKANRRENRLLRGKPPTPKGAKAKGLKKKK